MNKIQRTTLIEATNEAIGACVPPLNLALQIKLREVARTTRVFGNNYDSRPPCIAGQAVPYPFDKHGCSHEEHQALVEFGCAFDSVLSDLGASVAYQRIEVVES